MTTDKNANSMKNVLLIILTILTTAGFGQSLVILDKGMATLDGKQWLIVSETSANNLIVKDLSGGSIAKLTFQNKGDKVFLQGEFATVEKKYDVYYPSGTTIQTILESYNKNKVIVDGKIDLKGLQSYCDTRKIPLLKLLSAEEQKEYNDSLKKQGKRFSFGIYYGLAYSFRIEPEKMTTLTFNNPDGERAGDSFKYPSSSIKGMLNDNVGIHFEFRLRKNVFLNTGLNYTKVSYITKDSTTIYTSHWDITSPIIKYGTTRTLQIKENYYFISLPICVYYRLNVKKNYYTFGGGLSLSNYRSEIIISSRATYVHKGIDNKNKSIELMGAALARFGIFRTINVGMALGFETEFKYYMLDNKMATIGGNLILKF
jgi:hypothetical protein